MDLPISQAFINAAAKHGITPATEKHRCIKVPEIKTPGYEIGQVVPSSLPKQRPSTILYGFSG